MKVGEAPFLKGIQLSASSRSDDGAKSGVPSSLSFGRGQLLRGEIVGLTTDGKVLLSFGGQTVEARSEVALKPGSYLWLEVQQTEPLWLRMAEKKGAAQEFLRQYFVDPAALGKGLRALLGLALLAETETLADQAKVLQSFANAAVGPVADPERIIRLLSMLGNSITAAGNGTAQTGLETKKLHDLLAMLAGDREGIGGKSNAAAMQKLGLLLKLQNELNALPIPSGQSQFLLFPCLFAMGAGVGQWLFTLDRGEESTTSGERGYMLSFFLEMSRLGEVQIQLRVKDQSLQGECLVSGETVREYVAGRLAELEELLGKLGYGSVHFACRIARTSMLESLKTGIEAAAQLDSVRIIDLEA